MNDRISVIIPNWNSAATLEKAVASALCQTFAPLEILVCDDGSSDESRRVTDSINDHRVRWLDGKISAAMRSFQNASCGRPRNRGIFASQGEWLAFLDSDDEWVPEKLEKQLAYAKKMDCDAVCSNAFRLVSSPGNLRNYYDNDLDGKFSYAALLKNNPVICSSVLIKKEVVNKCKGFIEDRQLLGLEDYALWLRAATLTDFAYIPEPLVIYRDDPESSVRAYGSTVWEQRIHVLQSFVAWASDANFISHKKTVMTLVRRSLWKAKINLAINRMRVSLRKLKGRACN